MRAPTSASRAAPRPVSSHAPVAFVTCRDVPALTLGDRRALEALASLGVEGRILAWDDPDAAWGAHGLVIVRSCWNYHLRPAAFLRWIDDLESARVPLLNPPAVLRWNLHKGYLAELQGQGVDIVPTELVPGGSRARLSDILRRRGWGDAVVKPAVGASSYRTSLTRASTAEQDQGRFEALLEGDTLVQEFLPEIPRGEWSLVFIGGEYSHAVVKTAAEGEFRVQKEYGGRVDLAEPPAAVRAAAERALAHAARLQPQVSQSLYARADGVEKDARFLLGELELIEPELFLEKEPRSPERFAKAVLAALGAPTPAPPRNAGTRRKG